MVDYKKMYSLLFNQITAALKELDRQNIGLAKSILQSAQQQTEEMYISPQAKEPSE